MRLMVMYEMRSERDLKLPVAVGPPSRLPRLRPAAPQGTGSAGAWGHGTPAKRSARW